MARKVTRGSPPRLARTVRPRTWAAGRPASPTTTAVAPRAPSGGSAPSGDDDGDSTLGVYFREMSGLGVMSPEQELRAATRISDLRVEQWRRILSYPPFAEPIATFILEQPTENARPEAELGALQQSSRLLRDRETKAHRDDFERDRLASATALAFFDTDGILADRILADLQMLEAGSRDGVSMAARPPRRGSKPFEEYVARVRQSAAMLRSVKNLFVKSNLRLVVSIARRFNHGRMPLQDLIQEGNIGLMKAVDRFDHRKGFRFSTYGSWWIRHAISRAIADKGRAVRLPVHMIDAYHKVSRARRELETLQGRDPTAEELAKHTGLAAAKIEKMDTLLLEAPMSLDRTVSEADGRKVLDFIEDEATAQPGETLEADALNQQVREVIGALRPIEADILRKRFGLGADEELTLKEIGEQYSLSRERIRQLQEQALGKIRRELQRRDLI